MASILRQANKRKAVPTDAGEEVQQGGAGEAIRRNKQRVLLIPSRGVTSQMRHLVSDLEVLMPHSKKGEYPVVGAMFSFSAESLSPWVGACLATGSVVFRETASSLVRSSRLRESRSVSHVRTRPQYRYQSAG